MIERAATDDAAGEGAPLLAECMGELRELFGALARHIIGGNGETALDAARGRLETLTAAIDAERHGTRAIRADNQRDMVGARTDASRSRDDDLSLVAGELHEIALEEFDATIALGHGRDGGYTVTSRTVSREAAHVMLLETLYDRVEAAVATSPMLALERAASRWYFDRWSAARQGAADEAAWRVREREWSLVERTPISLRAAIIETLHGEDFFRDAGNRQRALARSLTASFASVFVVLERIGTEATVEDLSTRRRYRIAEHVPALEYQAGHYAFGRIIPFERGMHLRSPGMILVGRLNPALVEAIAGYIRQPTPGLGPQVLIEGMLARVVRGATIPRPLPPADSPAEAGELVASLRQMLETLGLATRAAATEMPEELRASVSGVAQPEYWQFNVDEVVGAWMQALGSQALSGPKGGAAKEKAVTKRGKEGRKRRK